MHKNSKLSRCRKWSEQKTYEICQFYLNRICLLIKSWACSLTKSDLANKWTFPSTAAQLSYFSPINVPGADPKCLGIVFGSCLIFSNMRSPKHCSTISRSHLKKVLNPWSYSRNGYYEISPRQTENPKRPPPFNLTIYKGQKNVILSRSFVK